LNPTTGHSVRAFRPISPPNPKIAFIAEAPGENEVREGKPLVGASGKEFQSMCCLAGIDPDATFRGNVISIRGQIHLSMNSLSENEIRQRLQQLREIHPRARVGRIGAYSIRSGVLDIFTLDSGMNFHDCTLNLLRTGPTSYVLSVESPCGLWRIPLLSLSCVAQPDKAPALFAPSNSSGPTTP
jgi:hypothetical protein